MLRNRVTRARALEALWADLRQVENEAVRVARRRPLDAADVRADVDRLSTRLGVRGKPFLVQLNAWARNRIQLGSALPEESVLVNLGLDIGTVDQLQAAARDRRSKRRTTRASARSAEAHLVAV